jgi:hypothetical protein
MSIVGPSGLNALGLAGSVAGSQHKPEALKDRQAEDQAARQLQADRAKLSGLDLDDAAETDFSHGQVSDRDADGRLPWQAPERQPGEENAPGEELKPEARSEPDAECGQKLDLQA